MRILILTKRQYTQKDLLDDHYGRLREIPLSLSQHGNKVTGLCLSYANRKEGWFKDGAVSWKSINATPLRIPGLISFIRIAQQYAKDADIIWACSDSLYGIIGYMLSKKYGIPLIFDLYDNFESFLLASLPGVKQIYRYVVKNCDAVTCVSKPLEILVRSYGRTNPTVILENAVRKDLFKPLPKSECRRALELPQDARIIGTAGALTRNRGINVLFEAFERLKSRFSGIQLAFAGTRNIEIPQSSGVHDLGILPLERVPLLFNALDVAVICNQNNNFGKYCFPQKAREIMACNVPMVAANVGSMPGLLSDHLEWLYDPGNAASLAEILEKRISDRTTDYPPVPSWNDSASIVERIMSDVKGKK